MLRFRFIGSLVAIGIITVACADAAPTRQTTSSSPPTTSVTQPLVVPKPGEFFVPPCIDSNECVAGFVLDDVFFSVSCVGVRESAVSDEVIGRGNWNGEEVSVNGVEGFNESLLVAVSTDGGYCSEEDPDQRLSQWSFAFSEKMEQAPVIGAVCEVGELSAAQRLANGCHLDEELLTCGSGPGFPEEVLGNLGLYPQPSETFGADVAALIGTDNPDDLLEWHMIVEEQGPDGEYVQLLLREAPGTGELQYLLDGSDERFDSPRPCNPQPAG